MRSLLSRKFLVALGSIAGLLYWQPELHTTAAIATIVTAYLGANVGQKVVS